MSVRSEAPPGQLNDADVSTGLRGLLPWLLVLAATGFTIYAVGVGAPYYADDFQFVFEEPSTKVFHFFFNENPNNPLYRPLQASFLALVQATVGLNTAPIQLLQITLHILLAGLVFRAMTALGFSLVQARIASAWMVVSQANVHAVVSNDTLSQVGGTFFGCLSVWWMYRYCFEPRRDAVVGRHYWLSLLALALALWSKESSISYVAILGLVVLLGQFSAGGPRGFSVRNLLSLVPVGGVALFYLIGRSVVVSAQPRFGADDYAFHVGSNVLVNIALFLFGAIVPGNSVSVALAAQNAHYLGLGLTAGATALLLGLVLFGWWRSPREEQVLFPILLASAGFAMFPMVLMNHVSELYVYNWMPFIAMLGAVGLGRLYTVWESDRRFQAALVVIGVLMVLSHGVSVVQKAGMMKRQGQRAGRLLEQITPFARELPQGGMLVLLNPPKTEPGYSSFKSSGFMVLRKGTHRISALADRQDVTVRIVDDLDRRRAQAPCLVLSLDGERVAIDSRSAELCASPPPVKHAGGWLGSQDFRDPRRVPLDLSRPRILPSATAAVLSGGKDGSRWTRRAGRSQGTPFSFGG